VGNLSIPPDWLPVAANISVLPYPLRRYIHDLETNCDPAGMVREAIVQRENAAALAVRVRELEAACRTAKEERNIARSRAWELARERRGAAALVQKLAAAEARTDEVIATLGPDVERLTGERDRARALLREAREYIRHAPEVTCEWDGMVAGSVEHATIRCTCGAAAALALRASIRAAHPPAARTPRTGTRGPGGTGRR